MAKQSESLGSKLEHLDLVVVTAGETNDTSQRYKIKRSKWKKSTVDYTFQFLFMQKFGLIRKHCIFIF